MLPVDRNPSRRQLLVFSATLPVTFAAVGILFWRATSFRAACAVWIAGMLVVGSVVLVPPIRRRLWIGWTYITHGVGWMVSLLTLAIVYYSVVTPFALALRLCRRDPLQRRFDKAAESYWVARPPNRSLIRYFRQF